VARLGDQEPSLAHLMPGNRQLSLLPSETSEKAKATEVNWPLWGSWYQCSPHQGLCLCGHRMQGQGAGEELGLPCVGTKTASGPGPSWGPAAGSVPGLHARQQGDSGDEPKVLLSPGPKGYRMQ
jgi:hypothetical protein